MIKFKGVGKCGKTFIIIGLSRLSLKEKSPIKIDVSELGIKNTKICIFLGKTEPDIKKDLEEFIGLETKIFESGS